jgi:ABC-type Fe3+/spermidine/putrescine transport system ATPase subunit
MRIAVDGLTKRFGKLEAVSGATFAIEAGELFTLLGPSGCGKTTLLRLVAGFHRPDDGTIRFGDRVVNDTPPHERGVGMVFQNYALWPHMTVLQNVGYGLKLRGLPKAEIAARCAAVLEKVKLTGLGERYPGQMSGGQQQRVALARALVLNPQILLLDEPLSNLDAKIRVQLRAEIRKLQKELRITALYVTHDQEEALTMSDRVAVLDHGKVLQIGPPRELYERPASRFVADFIGVNNLLDAVVRGADAAGRLRVATALGELTAPPDDRFREGDACVACVRPENASVGAPDGTAENRLEGRVSFGAYLGTSLRYDVDLGRGVLFKADVRSPRHEPLPPGSPVTVTFSAANVALVRADA